MAGDCFSLVATDLGNNSVLIIIKLLAYVLILIPFRLLAWDVKTFGFLASNVGLNTSQMRAADTGIILISSGLQTQRKTPFNRVLKWAFPELSWPLKWHDILQYFFCFWIQLLEHFGTIFWRNFNSIRVVCTHLWIILSNFLELLDATASVFVRRKYISLPVWLLNVWSREL